MLENKNIFNVYVFYYHHFFYFAHSFFHLSHSKQILSVLTHRGVLLKNNKILMPDSSCCFPCTLPKIIWISAWKPSQSQFEQMRPAPSVTGSVYMRRFWFFGGGTFSYRTEVFYKYGVTRVGWFLKLSMGRMCKNVHNSRVLQILYSKLFRSFSSLNWILHITLP